MSESIDYAERYRDEMESLNAQRGKRGNGGWAPPNGVYVVNLVGFKLTEITDKKTSLPCDLLSPKFKIVEALEVVGEADFDESIVVGKEFFGDTMCTAPDRMFTVADVFTLAEAIDGDEAETFGEACETCSHEATSDQSALIEVRVTRKADKKDASKEYVNTFINGAHIEEEEDDD